MSESGRILSVEEHVVGSAAASTSLVGAQDVFPVDADEFDPAGGELRHVAAGDVQTVYTYDDVDPTGGVVHLTTPLTTQVLEGEPLRVEPLTIIRDAVVALEDGTGDAIWATVPHSLVGRLESGVRSDQGEAVRVREVEPGSWELVDVLAKGKASAGFRDTLWTNDAGVVLIGGNEAADVGDSLFGIGMESAEFIAKNTGPVATTLPSGGSGTIRKIGLTGVDTGAIRFAFAVPVKINIEAKASLSLDEASACNVRLYVAAVNTGTDEETFGEQGVTCLEANDFSNGRQRQVSVQRQISVPEDPSGDLVRLNLWWGLASDAGSSQSVQVRHLSMLFRISYAPGMPTAESPQRTPAWTTDQQTIESYQTVEHDDLNPV